MIYHMNTFYSQYDFICHLISVFVSATATTATNIMEPYLIWILII